MFDAAGTIAWLRPRLIEGVEHIDCDESIDGSEREDGARSAAPPRYVRTLRDPATSTAHAAVLVLRDDPLVVVPDDAPASIALAMSGMLVPTDVDATARLAAAAQRHDIPALARVAAAPRAHVGTADPFEMLVRAIVGQQVTVAAATGQLARLATLGDPYPSEGAGDLAVAVSRVFPAADRVADRAATVLVGPRSRIDTVVRAASAVASGALVLDPDALDELRAALLEVKGIGPWTADYVRLRLGDHDVDLPGDVAVRRGAARLGITDLPAVAASCTGSRSALMLVCWNAAAGTVSTAD